MKAFFVGMILLVSVCAKAISSFTQEEKKVVEDFELVLTEHFTELEKAMQITKNTFNDHKLLASMSKTDLAKKNCEEIYSAIAPTMQALLGSLDSSGDVLVRLSFSGYLANFQDHFLAYLAGVDDIAAGCQDLDSSAKNLELAVKRLRQASSIFSQAASLIRVGLMDSKD